jgi:ABC-2 type transport system permease protein
MTLALVRKLLRDLRWGLLAMMVLLGAFQVLWAKVTERLLGQLSPLGNALASQAGMSPEDLQDRIFAGPGKIIRTIIGGETIKLDRAMDMLSIGYVHPLMQTCFCIWAVGRAAGAIAGEIDRGTMELLLAQPVARWRLVLAHFLVDVAAIPLLCLALWTGNWIGAWVISPIKTNQPELPGKLAYLVELDFGGFQLRVRVAPPKGLVPKPPEPDLTVRPMMFGRGLWLVGGLIFAISGYTMWLSSAGRFRWRVLGIAVFITLIQFLINILGQMWDDVAWMRPLTIFYYYQPQQVILSGDWCVTFREWNGGHDLFRLPMPLVLYGVGVIGYLMALWTLMRRDLPAPL